jgi:hypothetical protein
MPNMTVTDITVRSVELKNPVFDDELITFAGADDLAPGTILARDSVSKKLRLFVKGGSTNGNGIVCCVLPYRVVATGAGDIKSRVLIGGEVNKNLLVIDADGNDSNIDGDVKDALRARGIEPIEVKLLNGVDTHD